jgi:DNA-binding NarL/FixJ family response regulator
LRILVVDDHATVRSAITELLSAHADWLVCGEASDGIEAVEKAKLLRPDVVLMDISMPRMDGVQATRILRQELPKTRVIIVSQNDPLVVGGYAFEAGAAGFIAKSDLGHELIRMVDELGSQDHSG